MQQAWLRVGLAGMLAIALTSGIKPWGAALAGAFLPADLAADVAAAHLFVERTSPYGPIIRTVHMDLTGLPFSSTLPFFPHPPFSLILGLPMGFLSFRAAAACWFGLTLALLFALAVLLADEWHKGRAAGATRAVQFWLLLLAWPPVLYNLEKGQWSVLLAVLLALSWRAIGRSDLRGGAMWAAAAASVKVFPVALGAYFLLRSIRAAAWFAITGIVLAAIPLAWIGFDSLPAFLGESRLNLPYWESFPLVMFSIHGVVSRALVGGQFAQPFVHVPVVARVIEGILLAGLLGSAVWVTLQAKRGRVGHPMALLVWLALLPMLNPLSLGHNGVVLALPIVVLARTLEVSGRAWHRWAWAAAVILMSLPNQTVWAFATPLPTGPLVGLFIAALPTWGALLLFAVALSVAQITAQREGNPLTGRSGKLIASPAAS